jgi:hypothetical protein
MKLTASKLEELQKYREILDLPAKFRWRVLNKKNHYSEVKSSSKSQHSDSENLGYSKYVSRIISKPRKLANFRRPYVYRQILEHVNWELGGLYLERFTMLGGDRSEVYQAAVNDVIGHPRNYFYSNFGWLNPTQIRYLTVKQEMENLFDMKSIETIGEIGCGFGGQFIAITRKFKIKEYHFFDLDAVQQIIRFYISHFTFDSKIIYPDIHAVTQKSFDLVISNYAFSELPKLVQMDYINKILLNSKRGYMIMNSGDSNLTSRGQGKMSLTEIQALLPWIKTSKEIPLTGPDNYVIYWDRTRE